MARQHRSPSANTFMLSYRMTFSVASQSMNWQVKLAALGDDHLTG